METNFKWPAKWNEVRTKQHKNGQDKKCVVVAAFVRHLSLGAQAQVQEQAWDETIICPFVLKYESDKMIMTMIK